MPHWIDGQPANHLPADDRGFTLGDGHFTTMLVIDGRVCLWPLHRQRLCHANRTLGLQSDDWLVIEQELAIAAKGIGRGVLRLTLTRGSAGRGYAGQWHASPRRILSRATYPDHYDLWRERGIRAGLASTRLANGGPVTGLKNLGRLEQVLVKRELEQSDCDELLVRSADGNLVCASAGNLIVQFGDEIITPSLARAGIAGVTRRALMDWLPRHGFKLRCQPLKPAQLAQATSITVTNALMGAVPVVAYQEHQLVRASWLDKFNQALLAGELDAV